MAAGPTDTCKEPIEQIIALRVEFLFGVAEGVEAGPGLAHRVHVDGVEGLEGGGVEVELAGVAVPGLLEFFVADEDGGGDDAGAELEEDDGAGRGVEAGFEIGEAAFVFWQSSEEIKLLHFGHGFIGEAGDFAAHGQDAHGAG